MSRVKVGGVSKNDGEKGLIQSLPFTALFDTGAGPATGATATDHLATTLSIQDSTL
jgi:acyl-CoA reductase-like NAD-dependent aldehyde dehydrogenase